jgi:hypothetical protein
MSTNAPASTGPLEGPVSMCSDVGLWLATMTHRFQYGSVWRCAFGAMAIACQWEERSAEKLPRARRLGHRRRWLHAGRTRHEPFTCSRQSDSNSGRDASICDTLSNGR